MREAGLLIDDHHLDDRHRLTRDEKDDDLLLHMDEDVHLRHTAEDDLHLLMRDVEHQQMSEVHHQEEEMTISSRPNYLSHSL